MAPSKVAAGMNGQQQMINIAKSSTLVPATAADMTGHDEFAPSVWGDFFVTYVPPVSQACNIH
jgi:hypothetical protein